MKNKIAQALKTEYASFGLSQKALDGVASVIEKTIKDENEIGAAIKEAYVKDLLKTIQSESDSLRQARTKAERELEDYKREHPSDGHAGDPDKDDPISKRFADQEKRLADMEAKLLAAEKLSRDLKMIEEVHRIMRENGSDNEFIREITLAGVEIKDGDTAIKIAERCKQLYDENFKRAYGNGPVPPKGAPAPKDYNPGDYADEVDRLRAEGKLPTKA